MFSNIFLLFFSREICFLVANLINANSRQKTSKITSKFFCLKQTFTQNLETGFFFFRVAIKVLIFSFPTAKKQLSARKRTKSETQDSGRFF